MALTITPAQSRALTYHQILREQSSRTTRELDPTATPTEWVQAVRLHRLGVRLATLDALVARGYLETRMSVYGFGREFRRPSPTRMRRTRWH